MHFITITAITQHTVEPKMSKHLKSLLLICALSNASAWAQATPPTHEIDPQLVGEWEGEFKAIDEAACTAYKWHMTRKPDGTYRFHAYDATQTVLDDEGHWWVDKRNSHYFEDVDGQTEPPSDYHYSLSQNNFNGSNIDIEYVLARPLAANECSQTARFNETKLMKENP